MLPILQLHYTEIEKDILQQRGMMVKVIYKSKNQRSPQTSISLSLSRKNNYYLVLSYIRLTQ